MILIYSHTTSPRLQYISNFIFKELLHVDVAVTIDAEEFSNHDGPAINYSEKTFEQTTFHIRPNALLFEEGINEQLTGCFPGGGHCYFFKAYNADFPFDIFAASFYLLSRYEEYLPHTKDGYGRYAHENSLAFKNKFLHLPLVNIWVNELVKSLKAVWPAFEAKLPDFKLQLTYDIDIAYSFRHKGLVRNMGSFIKSPSAQRLKVLQGKESDPFDAYDWMDGLHDQYQLDPIYFFLVAEKNGRYDKNILPVKDAMWQLVKRHAKKYQVGLHPSWQSGDRHALLHSEKEQLEAMAEQKVDTARFHYIRFDLPGDYRRLIAEGFSTDHSMGYASINGFRASVASPFYWYDLEKETTTELLVHPFSFMEANAFYEQKLSMEATYDELMHYFNACKNANGYFSSIWHNHFLGTDPLYKGMPELYERFLKATHE